MKIVVFMVAMAAVWVLLAGCRSVGTAGVAPMPSQVIKVTLVEVGNGGCAVTWDGGRKAYYYIAPHLLGRMWPDGMSGRLQATFPKGKDYPVFRRVGG